MEIFHSYYFSLFFSVGVVVVEKKTHTMIENESRVCAKEEKLSREKKEK